MGLEFVTQWKIGISLLSPTRCASHQIVEASAIKAGQREVLYLNGLGYLCQKAETTWSHEVLMSTSLEKYLTILPLPADVQAVGLNADFFGLSCL